MKKKTSQKLAKSIHKKSKKKRIRKDKETHLIEIDRYVTKIIKEENRIPHQVEIAKAVHLSRETVSKLLGEISLAEIAKTHVSRLKTSDFIASMLIKGQAGNIAAAKLWLQIVHGWVDRINIGSPESQGTTNELLKAIAEGMRVK